MKITIKSILYISIALSLVSCGERSLNMSVSPVPVSSATAKTPATWELISEYRMPPEEGRFTSKFDFIPDHRLWSHGSSDPKADQLMYSDDFGKSWKFVNLPEPGFGADEIRFVDSLHGWVMGDSTLLKTQDGGQSWKNVRLPVKSKIVTLNTLEFTDPNHGFVAGSTTIMVERGLGTIAFGIKILCTSNGGESWLICYQNQINNTVLKMFSSGRATMALVDQKNLLITTDRGITWKQKQWDFRATDIAASPDGVLWTTSEDGVLRSSADLGDSWQVLPMMPKPYPEFRWDSLSFDAIGFGVAVGSKGAVAFTSDGGKSWALQSDVNLQNNLWTVRVQKPFVAIFDGTQLYVFRMKVTEKD